MYNNCQRFTCFSSQNPGCKVAFTLIQYFLVANFYWLLVEGVYLHSLITLAVFSEKSIYRYIALGWGEYNNYTVHDIDDIVTMISVLCSSFLFVMKAFFSIITLHSFRPHDQVTQP